MVTDQTPQNAHAMNPIGLARIGLIGRIAWSKSTGHMTVQIAADKAPKATKDCDDLRHFWEVTAKCQPPQPRCR